MTYNKIMKLKAESEARRVAKELERTGKAAIYCSSKKIGELELDGEGISFKLNSIAIRNLTENELALSELIVDDIECWSDKKHIYVKEESVHIGNTPNIITKESIMERIKEFDCNNVNKYLAELRQFNLMDLVDKYNIGMCFIGPAFIDELCKLLHITSISNNMYFDIRELVDILFSEVFGDEFAHCDFSNIFNITLQNAKSLNDISELNILDRERLFFFTDSTYEVLTAIKNESKFMYYILNYYCEYIVKGMYNGGFGRSFLEYKMQNNCEMKDWESKYNQTLSKVNRVLNMFRRIIEHKDFVLDYFENGDGKKVVGRIQAFNIDSGNIREIIAKIGAFDFSDYYLECNGEESLEHEWFYKIIIEKLNDVGLQ